jgi:ribonuclease HI
LSVESIRLYTDASVRGDFIRHGQRRQAGPAVAGWIAWPSEDTAERPYVAGVAFIGTQGPNRAEYLALILGLNAVLHRIGDTRDPVTEILAFTDNDYVRTQLNGERRASALKPWRDRALALINECSDTEINVKIRRPTKKDRGFKKAHSLTTSRGWAAVLRDPEWHPEKEWQERTMDDFFGF